MNSSPALSPPTSLPVGPAGSGAAFGTFGELLQGVLPGNRHFLVTFPIDRWSRAVFRFRDTPEIEVHPAGKRKSRQVARLVLDALGHRGGGVLHLATDLPEGKGLASSSADLVATVRAIGAAAGTRFGPATIESFLRHVEPSDGVMYDEIVLFHHREVRLGRRLGTLPPLRVLAHDEGGQLDTVRHNRRPVPFGAAEQHEYARLVDTLGAAIADGDLSTVGQVATRSARLNAPLRTHRHFAELERARREVDGLGLVLGHSGTVLGILLPDDDPELDTKIDHVRAACAPLPGRMSVYRSLGAGRTWAPDDDKDGDKGAV
ncbi:kinase [Planosporangium thailandense]|uniref:Kinase n=1 Tax=Planosporangium thailandense TaxID=765197 RepID=A0ABX0XXF9_9ACTN|nr:kinase [Planosporangium thailandense]NJC70738.1 kinase [Planosporangium thailandense]